MRRSVVGRGFRAATLTWALSAVVGCDRAPPETLEVPRLPSEPADHMVATPNPLATDAANRILAEGGNSMDAAVAAKMVLGFVEAPETGPGGGGFLMYYRSDTGNTRVYDGREVAPAAATPHRFTVLGHPVPLWFAVPQGQSVGVPGLIAMLGRGHEIHGDLEWGTLLAPAIELAENGIPMPLHLQQQIAADPSLRLFADTRRYFRAQADGDPPMLINEPLADVLKAVAEYGPEHFYRTDIASLIIGRARARHPGASDLTLQDFIDYEVIGRDPVCAPYRQWTLCGPAPPSSGGVTVLQILGMLEQLDFEDLERYSPEAVHMIAEASRLAFADRHQYIGDPDFSAVPVAELLDADYLSDRASLIDSERALPEVWPGVPAGTEPVEGLQAYTPDHPTDGTSHITVVDRRGNVASVTTSNEKPFGARMMAGGMVLNNQLTDFTFQPDLNGQLHPNAPEPGKRPRSSMAPFIVFNSDDRPVLALGTRGGSRIIGYMVQTLVEVLDWDVPLQEAVHSPRFVRVGGALELEADTAATSWAEPLRALGHEVSIRPLASGLHGVQRHNGQWLGAADPRVDGVATSTQTGQ